MRRLMLALAFITATTSVASADLGQEPQWVAQTNVLAMSSVTYDNVRQRALVLADGNGQALLLETIDLWANQISAQRWVQTFESGGYSYPLAANATGFDGISFQNGALNFALYTRDGGNRAIRCSVDPNAATPIARCDDNGRRPPRPRPQPATNWAAAPHVIAACDAAMYGSDKHLACLDQVSVAVLDPTPMIAACDSAMYGDDNTLACIGRLARSRVDPVPAIAACDAATYGDANTISCLEHAGAFRYPPAATIAACDAATYGEPSTLACVAATSRFAGDATATIAACDAATYGDDATIACIERGGAY